MAVTRIVAYAGGKELAASRAFYVEVLGMRVAMEDPVLDLQAPDDPAAGLIIGAQEMQDPYPSFGVDVGEPAAVDAAHAEAVRRGLRVVYPLTEGRGAFAASSSKTPVARSSTCSRTSPEPDDRASPGAGAARPDPA